MSFQSVAECIYIELGDRPDMMVGHVIKLFVFGLSDHKGMPKMYYEVNSLPAYLAQSPVLQ